MTPRRDTPAAGPASSLASGPGGTRESTSPDVADLASLVVELQARGLRVEVPLERRQGGAGPSDSGMLWVGGIPLTVPTDNATAAGSPYVLKAEDDGYAVYRDGRRLAEASVQRRPRFYDLTTAEGIPYWKIALLHLDSFASTVVQTCAYWGNDDQCTVLRHRRLARRRPHHREEDPGAAGRGGLCRKGARRGRGRDPDDRQLQRGRPGGALRGQVRAGRQGRVRAPRRGAVRAADGPGRPGRGRRPRHRLRRHPRRVVRPGGAAARRARQGPDRDRALLHHLGARRRAVRRGPGLHLRHPRHGGGPRADRAGLPACGRHGCAPVRRARCDRSPGA